MEDPCERLGRAWRSRYVNLDCERTRLWHGSSIFDQAFEVKLDCFANIRLDLLNGAACRYAARQIGNICGVIVGTLFDDDSVFPHDSLPLSPACTRTLFSVPG